VLTLTKPAETFVFGDIGEPPVPSLNRGFSAPIKLIADLSADDLRFLAAHDADAFNRWQALQTLATRLLLDNVASLRAAKPARQDGGLLHALGAILDDGTLEPAFIALALTLPGESDLAREIGRDVDPDAIFAARSVSIFWWQRAGRTLFRWLLANIRPPTT
jgi:aminopeptidase N